MGTRWPLACVLILSIAVTGCLKAERFSVLRYNPQRDSYSHLRIYCNIRSDGATEPKRAQDFDQLARLWQQREQLLVVNPIQIQILGDTEDQWLRIAPDKYRQTNLGKPSEATDAVIHTDLSKFQAKPGKLFLSHEETLGYYHQTEIPGSVIDAFLSTKQAEMNADLRSAVIEEQARRADAGAPRLSWKLLRTALRAALQQEELVDQPADLPPLSLFDDQSLRKLARGAQRNEISLKRNAGEIQLNFAISTSDAAELLKTIQQVQADSRSDTLPPWIDPLSKRGIQLLTVSQDGGKITASLDLLKLFHDEPARRRAFEPSQLEGSLQAVAAARERNLPIDSQSDLDAILDQFARGTLD